MKARELIERGAYSPDQIKIMGDVLEAVWERIAPDVGADPQAREAARLKLARIILRLTDEGISTPQELLEAAHREMFEPPAQL